MNLEAMEGHLEAERTHFMVMVETRLLGLHMPLKPYGGAINFIFQCNIRDIVV